ncbi:mimecan-like [Huso huso]|uniref:Mimecan n=1 Tax=Huso huso TaxID=61971 RepID=A0ABR0Z7S3_HUSHU
MNKLTPLLLSCILVPWVLSATVKKFDWSFENTEEAAISHEEDSVLNNEEFLEAKRPETDVMSFPQSDIVPDVTPQPDSELPTCLLCVCLTGSVYCEEILIDVVPTLPKETAYLYARYNKIKRIKTKDFANFPTLKRIDLTGNLIEEIEEGAFSKLPLLEELSLAENKLTKLPVLPAKLTVFNANYNMLKSRGVKSNAFRKLTNLSYLYLSNNQLDSVPLHLPESLRILHMQNNNITSISDETFCKGNSTLYIREKMEEIRLDGNPVSLAKYPNSFICLKMLPFGSYF